MVAPSCAAYVEFVFIERRSTRKRHMTNQGTAYPDSNVLSARKAMTEVRSAADAIEAAAPEMKAKLRHMVDSGKTRMTEWRGGLQDGIRERPIQYVLIAAAVGAVIGLLVGRRS
jgi:ElaB/YqjD/DUF883 family membrane-anchored ribosome-binding protein